MCVNCRLVFNPYARRSILVKCGKCEACQQEKAVLRSNRIRNNSSAGTLALFVTLTYTNDYIPYIKKSDLNGSDFDISILRDANCRLVYSQKYGLRLKKSSDLSIVDKLWIPLEYRHSFDVSKLSSLKNTDSDKVGVLYYNDFQNFIKRLRITLHRNYGITRKFTYYVTGEYGSVTQRPHFHALLFIPTVFEKEFRNLIPSCWPYADSARTSRYIEIARDAASYCSSYVNGNNCLPEVIKNFFPQEHHYSKNFGVGIDCFQLLSILEKIKQRDLYYHTTKMFDGTSAVTDVSIPSYVINRFFPKFKGYGRLSTSSLFNIAREPSKICEYVKTIDNPLYSFSSDETYRIFVRLSNAQQYFCNLTGLSSYDYAQYYVDVWSLLSSQHLKDSYKDIKSLDDFSDFYENWNDYAYKNGGSYSDLYEKLHKVTLNPNERKDIVIKTNDMREMYSRMSKQRKVTNYIMSSLGHNV